MRVIGIIVLILVAGWLWGFVEDGLREIGLVGFGLAVLVIAVIGIKSQSKSQE